LGLHVTKIDSPHGESIGYRRAAYASTMPKNRRVKAPSNCSGQPNVLVNQTNFYCGITGGLFGLGYGHQ